MIFRPRTVPREDPPVYSDNPPQRRRTSLSQRLTVMLVIRHQIAIAAYKVRTTKVVLQRVASAVIGEQVGMTIPPAIIFRLPGLVQPAQVLVPFTQFTPPIDLAASRVQ
jgi:hypothetical protein